jgi:hypothetical protein
VHAVPPPLLLSVPPSAKLPKLPPPLESSNPERLLEPHPATMFTASAATDTVAVRDRRCIQVLRRVLRSLSNTHDQVLAPSSLRLSSREPRWRLKRD